jgi:hypothetical protein
MAEARELLPGDLLIDVVPLCDDCYQRFLAWFDTLTDAERDALGLECRTEQLTKRN